MESTFRIVSFKHIPYFYCGGDKRISSWGQSTEGQNNIISISQGIHWCTLYRINLSKLYLVYIRLLYACELWDNCVIGSSQKLKQLELESVRIVIGLLIFTQSEILYIETGWELLSVFKHIPYFYCGGDKRISSWGQSTEGQNNIISISQGIHWCTLYRGCLFSHNLKFYISRQVGNYYLWDGREIEGNLKFVIIW
jgi:hypothetical protein